MRKRDRFRRGFFLLPLLTLMLVWPEWRLNAEERVTARDWRNGFVQVAQKVQPSVVSIRSERTVTVSPGEGFGEDFFKGTPFEDFFRQHGGPPMKRKQMGEGSGVIVDPKGYILTNYHVVAGADKLTVQLFDGRELQGTVQGTDSKTDLAVVHVEVRDLPLAVLGDSDKIQVGEWAIAIGSPFGLKETVTVGVISAKGRTGLGTGTYEDFIQTDASINPGNSGGPLVNIEGEVIGINAMIISPGQGIGFAIPINLAKSIMVELIQMGKVIRPWVGIGLQDLTPELMKSFNITEKEGVLISQIYERSPAEKAGLKVGDVIVQIDGKRIKNGQDVVREVLKKQVDQEILFEVIRDGKRVEVPVVTAQMPTELGERKSPSSVKEWFGLRVITMTPDMAKQLGLSKAEGVIIEGVEMGSAAQGAGLRKGDVILEVNRQRIKDENDYRNAMEKVKSDQGVLLLVNREGSNFFVSLKEAK
jgi:Do/DeqQ family serine protease